MPTNVQIAKPNWGRLSIALALVYIVWGTTYYALGFAVRFMPPVSMNSSRFVLAGVLMMAFARFQQQAWPTPAHWRSAAVVGGLMAFAAMTLVTHAQRLGVGSGLMTTVVTTMPMWLALWTQWGGERVHKTAWLGLALGVGGAMLLALERDFAATPLGAICAFGAPLCWSLGSYASRKLPLPEPAMAAGAQWLIGGLIGAALALAAEQPMAMFNAPPMAWLSWVYLLVFGTMGALSAYLWLLKNASAALAGSYAFVNPAVALWVGVVLGAEHVTGWVWLALPLIFGALALILAGPQMVQVFRFQMARILSK